MLVAELTAATPAVTKVEILSVVRPVVGSAPAVHLERFIASKVRALLIAHGLDVSRIATRTGGVAVPVEEIDPSTWRASHYVGFRLAY